MQLEDIKRLKELIPVGIKDNKKQNKQTEKCLLKKLKRLLQLKK